jgi:hypothetical protein
LHNAIVGDQSDLVMGLRLCGAGQRTTTTVVAA